MACSRHRRAGLALTALLAGCLSACGRPAPPATPSPAPTASPTATTVPLPVVERLARPPTAEPEPGPGAPCGLVDTLDFPLGPPDGEGFAARWPFGRESGRYDGIHAGEDWVRLTGSTLGEPVHAIGHGQVVYAQPFGWGQVDRGVIIVRHRFADGGGKLSFYGHVQPDSVTLRAGDCVRRGEAIARVDKPRGRPHLHFELRDHLADRPGPGYWPRDPRSAGWYPPSAFLHAFRAGLTPGVAWQRPFTDSQRARFLGRLADGSLAVQDGSRLLALDPASGAERWRGAEPADLAAAVVDDLGGTVYVATADGEVRAYLSGPADLAAPGAGGAAPPRPSANDLASTLVGVGPEPAAGPPVPAAWTLAAEGPGAPGLWPLPGGGLAVWRPGRLTGHGPGGERRWSVPAPPRIASWALAGGRLLLSTDYPEPRLYALDATGRLEGPAGPGGLLAAWGDQVARFGPDGLAALDPATLAVRFHLPLAAVLLRDAQLAALPDGELLALLRLPGRRELVRVRADGQLRWRRSLAALGGRGLALAATGHRAYLLDDGGALFAVDEAGAELQRRLAGRGVAAARGQPLALGAGGLLLLDAHDGRLLAWRPEPEPSVGAD